MSSQATIGYATTLIGSAVLATLVCAALTLIFRRRRHIRTAALRGQGWPATVALLASWMSAEVLSTGVTTRVAGWTHLPLPGAWVPFYVIVSTLLLAAWALALLAGALMLAELCTSITVWLHTPLAAPWEAITNGQRLRSSWRLHRYERRLCATAAAHLDAAAGIVTRERICTPAGVATWLVITPGLGRTGLLADALLATPLVAEVEVVTSSADLVRLRIGWDNAGLYSHRASRPQFAKRVAGSRCHRLWPHRPGFSSRRPAVLAHTAEILGRTPVGIPRGDAGMEVR